MEITSEHSHTLRMPEESLARELNLEKRIYELKQNEDDLRLKLQLTEQIAFCMEEAAEVIWGRFLEAENAAEVLMGISKDLAAELQIVQVNFNYSIQREGDLRSKLRDCIEGSKANETALRKLESEKARSLANSNSSIHKTTECHIIDNEQFGLKERVKLLEKELEESTLQLESANASSKLHLERLSKIENEFASLKENISKTESRAEHAESRLSVLTETNIELRDELGYLKGGDNDAEKLSLLEKKIGELEFQLQQAKASAEANQEQQMMLYSAMYDMETLIGDLTSRVSQAESKAKAAENQCIILSEINSKLNEEVGDLKARVESLQISLRQANDAKVARAKEINVSTKLMMDMITQLRLERKRIQCQHCQLHSSINENKHSKGDVTGS